MGAECKNGPTVRRAPAVHCCKSQSHYTGDEGWENMGTGNFPQPQPRLFSASAHNVHAQYLALQQPQNHRCSKSFPTDFHWWDHFKNTISPSFFYSFSFFLCWLKLLAEDHHSVTHRYRNVLFFKSNTSLVIAWDDQGTWEASIRKKTQEMNFNRTSTKEYRRSSVGLYSHVLIGHSLWAASVHTWWIFIHTNTVSICVDKTFFPVAVALFDLTSQNIK